MPSGPRRFASRTNGRPHPPWSPPLPVTPTRPKLARMRSRFVLMTLLVLGAAALAENLPSASWSTPDPPTEVAQILDRLLARARQVSADTNTPPLVFDKVSLQETLNSDGSVKRLREKRYEVSLIRGMTHNRLVSVDGRALGPDESAVLTERERRWRETYATGQSGAGPDRMDSIINEKLIARFDFAWTGDDTLHGRPCHVLSVQPKSPPLPTERLMDRVINQLSGRLWVDALEYEVVRAEVATAGTLRVWGGILGSLEDFQLHVDRERGHASAWFNRHLEVQVRGRRLFSPIAIRLREVGSGLRLIECASAPGVASLPPSTPIP